MSSPTTKGEEGSPYVNNVNNNAEENDTNHADNTFDRLARFLRDDSWRKNMCSMLSNDENDEDDEGGGIMSPLQFVLSIGSNLKTVREVYERNPNALNVSTFYVACENIASPGVLSFLLQQQPNLIQQAHEQDLSLVDAILFGYPEPEPEPESEGQGPPPQDHDQDQDTLRREDNIRVLVKAWPPILLTTYRAYAETTLERCLISKRCTTNLKQFLVSMFPQAQDAAKQEFILHNGPEMDLHWLSQILPKIQSFKSYSDQWEQPPLPEQPQPQQQQPQPQQDSSTATSTATSFHDLVKLVLLENQHLEQVHLHLPITTSSTPSRRSSASSAATASSSSSSCYLCQEEEEEEEQARRRKRRRLLLEQQQENNGGSNKSHHRHHHHREPTLLSLLKESLTTKQSKLAKLVLVGIPRRQVVTYEETILKTLQHKNTILQSLQLYCGQWSSPQNEYGQCYFPLPPPVPPPPVSLPSVSKDDNDDDDMDLDYVEQQDEDFFLPGDLPQAGGCGDSSVGRRLQHYLLLNQFGRAKVKNAETTVNDFLDLLGKVRDYQPQQLEGNTNPNTNTTPCTSTTTTTSTIMSVEYDLLQEMLGSHPGLLPSLLASIK